MDGNERKRPLSPVDDRALPSKVQRMDFSDDPFSPEAIAQFQKEAIWRQMQEYKQALSYEKSENQKYKDENRTVRTLLYAIAGVSSKVEQTEFVSDMQEVVSSHSSPQFKDFLASVKSSSPISINEIFRMARSESDSEGLQQACFELEELKENNQMLTRKILRLEAELVKRKPVEVAETAVSSSAEPEASSKSTEPGPVEVEEKALKTELEALKALSQHRADELRRLADEYSKYKADYEILCVRFAKLHPSAEKDAIGFEELYRRQEMAREELQSRIERMDALERSISEYGTNRSQAISALEEQLAKRRYQMKEFADAAADDVARVRKERDHMRKLYETVNMQLSSANKHRGHLETLTEQLEKRLSTSAEKLKSLISESKDTDQSEALLLAEIESVGEALEMLQKQNQALLKELGEKDEVIARISGEKLKAEFDVTQVQREADLAKQKASKVEADSMRAADEAEDAAAKLRALNEKLERGLLERASEVESLRLKLIEAGHQVADLRASLNTLASRASDPFIVERFKALERVLLEKKLVEEELQVATAKLAAYASSLDSVVNKDLQEELNIYRKLMKCNSCHTREKSVVLSKCMHVFCKTCIDTRLETRQRKCPNCAQSKLYKSQQYLAAASHGRQGTMSGSEGGSLKPVPSLLSHQSSLGSLKPVNKKRETEFRNLFPGLPAEEQLIDTFSCALNKEILIHGRLYLSERHLSFNANILGWVTNVVIAFSDVMSVEKRMTAFVIPNAIQVSTLQHKFFFTSFISRDQTFGKIMFVWKNALSDQPLNFQEIVRTRSLSVPPKEVSKSSSLKRNFSLAPADTKRPSLNCACVEHFTEHIAATSRLDFAHARSKLFFPTPSALLDACKQLGHELIDVAQIDWAKDDFGGCRRQWSLRMHLPTPLLSNETFVTARFSDLLLTDEPSSKVVVESRIVVEGIPGGLCTLVLRQCLTCKEDGLADATVTADIRPPEHSWFKESIKSVLLDQTRAIFRVAIEKAMDPTSAPQSHDDETVQLVYFDKSIFFRSLRAFLAVVGLLGGVYLLGLRAKTYLSPSANIGAYIPSEQAELKIAEVHQRHQGLMKKYAVDIGPLLEAVVPLQLSFHEIAKFDTKPE